MNGEKRKYWRQIDGVWHFVDCYTGASKTWTRCGKYLQVSIFDCTSDTRPDDYDDNFCAECLSREKTS